MDAPKQPAEQSALTLIRWFKRGLAIALVVVVVKCSFFAGCAFEQRGWIADFDGDTGVRYSMGERLAQRQLLLGMTRAEVVDTLGEPMTHDEFMDWDLVYDLGPARGFLAMGRDFLVVKLATGGFVDRCRIMSDG